MGSTSSKDAVASSSSSSSSIGRRTRSMGTRVFQSSCLGRSNGHYEIDNSDQVSSSRNKGSRSLGSEATCTDQTSPGSNRVMPEFCRKVQHRPNDEVPSISSDTELEVWGQDSVTRTIMRPESSSSQAGSTRALVPSNRPRSRFSFIPGSLSFRLSRAASLGSSRTCSLFSHGLAVSNAEESVHVHMGPTNSGINRNGVHQVSNILPVCNSTRFRTPHHEEASSEALQIEPPISVLPAHLPENEINPTQDRAADNANTNFTADASAHSLSNLTEVESTEIRRLDRRIRAREPVERSVRFSRTLSVGRLRDRVLRRSSFSDALFGRLQEDREVRYPGEDNTETPEATLSLPPSNDLNSMYNTQDDVDASRSREARYHDMVERRTDFLERRRRIRSQVRALQRLGSRFENLSGHERSCILSGQHRTGRCTCRASSRTTNPDDDSSARASISRIVMLAEALFEVLDEIHQQSVVLSSRPSMSSIGSVPAPKEVVESMPLKLYNKSPKLENEDPQCYICLVEYEEGDSIRVLPCHHEFHQMCIDKWLKEIHRVCPLCRGDVCRSESLAADN